MEKEKWKPVRGFEEYAEISNFGQIHRFEREWYSGRGNKTKRIKEEDWTYGHDNGKGYLYATIGGKSFRVNRLVYITFVGDIPEGLEVNHLDEDKHNNRLDNLNLMTPKENNNWGNHNARVAAALRGRKRPDIAASRRGKHYPKLSAAKTNHPNMSKAVQALDKDGNVVMEFPSTAEAQRQGFNSGNISRCCNGKLKTAYGFIWRFRLPQ